MATTRTNSAVWIEKYQRWQINVQRDKKRRTFYSSIKGTKGKAACHSKADKWLKEGLESQGLRVQKVYEDFLVQQDKINGGVQLYYHSIGNKWIIPNIGNIKIGNLTLNDTEKVILKAYDAGLAKSTLGLIKSTFTLFLAYARGRHLTKLTTEGLKVPKGAPEVERKSMSIDNIKILFSSDKTTFNRVERTEWFIHAFRFAVAAGYRPGEVKGIQPARDLCGNILTISESITSLNKVTKGKNKNARKPTQLSQLAMDIIADQLEMLRKAGFIHPKYLFPDTDGEFVDAQVFRTRWKNYSKFNGIDDIVMYELRHTTASVCQSGGMTESDAKLILRHSEKMKSYKTYGHEMDGDQARVANKIDNIFSKIL